MTGDMFGQGTTQIVTADFLAECFGVGRSMIYKYIEAGMPREARGRYHLAKCVQWYVNRVRNDGPEAEADRGAQDARVRLVEAQRIKTELETKKLAGRLIDRGEVAEVINEVAAIVATQLDALAPRVANVVAPMTEPAMIQAEILTEARALRTAIAGEIEKFSDDRQASAAAVNGGPDNSAAA